MHRQTIRLLTTRRKSLPILKISPNFSQPIWAYILFCSFLNSLGHFFQIVLKRKLCKSRDTPILTVLLFGVIFIIGIIKDKYEFICLCCMFNGMYSLEAGF